MSAAMDAALSREGMLMALTNQEALDIIEKTPGSIGFSSLAQIKTENRSLKMLSYNGVRPNTKSHANGTYPLSLKFSLITKPERSPAVRHFIDFVRSHQGSMILEKSGNVPIGSKGKE
jgi:phosphate transport system substrate-binding protein